MFNDIV